MDEGTCWNCSHPTADSLFCTSCNSLQPPTRDYYRFFGLERRLDIDTKELEKLFYNLSRKLHPDRYFRAAPEERRYSLEATAILNDAYRTLKDPLARAEYVLKEEGFDIGEQKSKDVPPELLEEVFELNLTLEELRGGEFSARPQLEAAHQKFLAMRGEVDTELGQLFQEYDRAPQRSILARIRSVLNRRRYIRNLVNEVEKELAA